jgi:HK97 family phage prohead protease
MRVRSCEGRHGDDHRRRDGHSLHREPPDAQWARDAMASIRRGDVDQNSFAFMVAEPRASNERWERRKDGIYRIISKARLVEVGPQTHPAYADTSVAVRSMQAGKRATQCPCQATCPKSSLAI